MRTKAFLFFLFFSCVAFGQAIQGTVFDEQKKPLPGATVYLDGTTISTTTDAEGKYYFVVKEKINSSLVISYIGYNSVTIKSPFENNYQKSYLLLKSEALKEVIVVGTNGFSRKDKLKVFREYFLGNTTAGKSCTIANEDAIEFIYDYNKNELIAKASVPLIVNNPYLGYEVKFDLHVFSLKFFKKSINEDDVTRSVFFGTALFLERVKDDKVKERREKVYQGSSMQFFKNLAENRLGRSNFVLIRKGIQANPGQYFKVQENGDMKKVTVLKNDVKEALLQGTKPEFYSVFDIMYKKEDQSQIIFTTDTFDVDNFGNNTNIINIEYTGVMASKKLGDLLPMNFISKDASQ